MGKLQVCKKKSKIDFIQSKLIVVIFDPFQFKNFDHIYLSREIN